MSASHLLGLQGPQQTPARLNLMKNLKISENACCLMLSPILPEWFSTLTQLTTYNKIAGFKRVLEILLPKLFSNCNCVKIAVR